MSERKINLKDTIDWLIIEFKKIDSTDEKPSIKTPKFQRLAIKFNTILYRDGRRSIDDRLTLKTARGYISKARSAIKEITGMHHGFERNVNRLVKKYNRYSDLIAQLNDIKTPNEATEIKNSLLKGILHAVDLRAEFDSLDFSKRTIKNKIKKLAEKYPTYEYYIRNLDSEDYAITAKVELIKALNESTEVYKELNELKIDHELVVSLVITDLDTAYFTKDKKTRVMKRKTNNIYVNYPSYMNKITTILEHPKTYFNDEVNGVVPLIFALCAVTGRRLIEVVFMGNFKVKDKNNLIFSGQAKKRNDDFKENVIYSLINSEVVVSAIKILRENPVIKKTVTESKPREHFNTNEIIKVKIAPDLNDFTKDFFVDKNRVSKDTRGIYARICYERWYLNDPRWKKKDSDIFFLEIFCHSDKEAQETYKPYRLDNFTRNYKPEEIPMYDRWLALCELDEEAHALSKYDTTKDIHTWVKKTIEQKPNSKITQTGIHKGTNCYRPAIKRYLDFIGELALPGEPLTTQREEENDTIEQEEPETQKKPIIKKAHVTKKDKPEKPHFNVKQLKDDNHWEVIIRLKNKTKLYELYASSHIAAMKTAYALFTDKLFEFKVTIPFNKGPFFEDTVFARTEDLAIAKALPDARLEGFLGAHGKITAKKL